MKRLLLLIMILFTCGCTNNAYVYSNIDDNIFCNVKVNNSNREIINLLKQEKYFICNNLEKYLDYSILNTEDISTIVKEVNVGLYRDYYKDVVESDLSKDYLVLVNKYYYLKDNYVPNDLENISTDCSVGINSYLRHEARLEFEKLCQDAKKDNINIYNLSAYRSYEKQNIIYNNKVKTKDVALIDSVSARPGHSEHQTGLTVDINLLSKQFDKTNEYYWMINNSYKYGFILRYPMDKEKLTGYDYEPWHYRYVGRDVALAIHSEDITFDEYYAYYIDNN